MMHLDNILPFTHYLLQKSIKQGDYVVDGTMGNGHDTLLLAKLVGKQGKVWAFDVQQQALEQTAKRLQAADEHTQVELILDSHAYLANYVQALISAAVFNFGWLPGADKTCTTQAASSIQALNQALSLLKPEGVIVAVLYPGHDAGNLEAQAIETWAMQLPQQAFSVLKYGFINRQNQPPYLLAIEKLHQR